MRNMKIFVGLVFILVAAAAFAQSKQPTQKEVSEYIKLLDAKITFNRAQGNTSKVKQLKAEKQRTLKKWKALQKKSVSSSAKAVKAQTSKPSAKKTPAQKPSQPSYTRMPSTQDDVRAYIQRVDSQIASFKAQGNVAKVKALRAEKQKVLRNWNAIQKRSQKTSSKKTTATAVKQGDLAGPVGTWLNNGHTAFRVVDTEFKDADPRGQRAPEGTRFFVVTVEIKNKDPFTAVYGGDYHRVMVIDKNRVYYMENISKNPVNWADNEDIKELMTDETFKTAYVFTMPTEAEPEKLVFDASSADKYPVMNVSLK